MSEDTAAEITRECRALEAMLLQKNAAYGDSALCPVRIFSTADSIEQLKVRLDDKLSRISRGQAAGEDVEVDLLGYLMLLRIAKRRQARLGQTLDDAKEKDRRLEAARIGLHP